MATFPSVGDDFGPYRIMDRLGQGGMGAVFLAMPASVPRPVALKVLLPHLAESAEYRARFEREATALVTVDSPHIIQVFDHGEHDGCLFLATQFIKGHDLDARLREGPLAWEEALQIARQVCSALTDAHHAGVIHRDVKPQNVLLRTGASGVFAYLCDFGIAQAAGPTITQTGSVAGTWSYLAPERITGSPATAASDVYALGCLVWAMLTGRPPYRGEDFQIAHAHVHDPVPQLPADTPGYAALNDWLRRAMAKDPQERFGSAAQAAAALPVALPPPGAEAAEASRTRIRRSAEDAATAPLAEGADRPAGQASGDTPVEEPVETPSYEPVPAGASGAGAGGGPGRSGATRSRAATVLLAALGLILVLGLLGGGWWWGWWPGDGADGDGGDADDSKRPVASASRPFGDFDGDGLDDLAVSQGEVEVFTNLGGKKMSRPRPVDLSRQKSNLRGDFDGDGLADLAQVACESNQPTINLRRNDGRILNGWGPARTVRIPCAGSRYFAADVTGDRRSDLVVGGGEAGELWLLPSSPTGLAEPKRIATAEQWPLLAAGEALRFLLNDVDGDGRADLVIVEEIVGSTRAWVARSTEDGFDEPAAWGDQEGWRHSEVKLMVGNFDGDEDDRGDLAGLRKSEEGLVVEVLLSRGDSFALKQTWLSNPEMDWAATRPVSANLDGDPRTDLLTVEPTPRGAIMVGRTATTGGFDEPIRMRTEPGWSTADLQVIGGRGDSPLEIVGSGGSSG